MRLQHKTTLFYLIVSIPLVGIAAFVSYYVIRAELKNGTEEVLRTELHSAKKIIRTFGHPQSIRISSDGLSKIQLVENALPMEHIKDTLIFDPIEKENVEYTILRSNFRFKNQLFQIDLYKNNMDSEELLEGLWAGFGILIAFLFSGFLFVNWFISKTIWKPFFATIHRLEKYDLKQHDSFKLEQVSTYEFNQLNTVVNTMTNKIQNDFIQHKEFTENASHEMQTPLAVIKANLSILMQAPSLSEVEMNAIESIENTIKKLSALNRTLLLLTKIDNQQFTEVETLDLSKLCSSVLENYADLINSRDIKLELNLEHSLQVTMNGTLAEILISNLIQNAIRHNLNNGEIFISTTRNSLILSNTGNPLTMPSVELFLRFRKSVVNNESIGLGLSLVKSITEKNGFSISHSYSSHFHTFTLTI
ncbi:MAG: hypothetical protein RI922_355 [Bacteroidota bacterium]|jgi:signal transduction histidine kinase